MVLIRFLTRAISSQNSKFANPVDYTNSLTIGTNSTWIGQSLKKLGNLCQVQANITFNIANTGLYSLGYVPSDCRPLVDISVIYAVPNGSYAKFTIYAADGQILVYASQSLYNWSISVHELYISK